MRLRWLLLCVLAPLALWLALPLSGQGAPTAAQKQELERKIGATREKIGKRKGTERVLSKDIAAYTRKIDALQSRISVLSSRQARIEAELRARKDELDRVRTDLRSERARVVRLRQRLAVTKRQLAARLVELYQAGQPDLVTVILRADGFAELLERSEFLRRINDQDKRIVRTVREARADAIATEARLDRLEARQAKVTAIVQERRDQLSETRLELVGTRVGLNRTRAGKSAALKKVRTERNELEEDLEAMEAQSARIAAQLRAAQSPSGSSSYGGPIARGTGRLQMPVNGTFTSPFGPRWGRLHAGIDLAAPEGTPIYAADSGTVVLMQGVGASGGYGNYTCIAHGSSLSTCYAHQSRFATSAGARVRKGQLIGYVGNTGHSFGAHLHFEVRINGTPVDPMGYL